MGGGDPLCDGQVVPSMLIGGGVPLSEGQVVSDIEDTSDDVVDNVSEKCSSSSRSGGSGDRGEPVRGVSDRSVAVRLRFDTGSIRPPASGNASVLPIGASIGSRV